MEKAQFIRHLLQLARELGAGITTVLIVYIFAVRTPDCENPQIGRGSQ